MAMTKEERIKRYPPVTFVCLHCGKTVVTDSSERIDRRTKFCSKACERAHWRKITRHAPPKGATEEDILWGKKRMVTYRVGRVTLHGVETLDFNSRDKKVLECVGVAAGAPCLERFFEHMEKCGFRRSKTAYNKLYSELGKSYSVVIRHINLFARRNLYAAYAMPAFRLYGAYAIVELERDHSLMGEEKKGPQQSSAALLIGSQRGTDIVRVGFSMNGKRSSNIYNRMRTYFLQNGFLRSRQCFYSEEKMSKEWCLKIIDGFFEKYPKTREYFRTLTVTDGNGMQDITQAVREGRRLAKEQAGADRVNDALPFEGSCRETQSKK